VCFVTVEIEGVRQRGRLRKTWKEVVVKDVDDLHIKPSDATDHSKWRRTIRRTAATEAIAVMLRVEHSELYVSDAGSRRLTWI